MVQTFLTPALRRNGSMNLHVFEYSMDLHPALQASKVSLGIPVKKNERIQWKEKEV